MRTLERVCGCVNCVLAVAVTLRVAMESAIKQEATIYTTGSVYCVQSCLKCVQSCLKCDAGNSF